MTGESQSQQDPALYQAPSGVPQPKGSPKWRKIIGGVIIACIVVIIFLPWIIILLQLIFPLIFGSTGACNCPTKVVAATAQQPDNGTIIIIYHGGQSAETVEGLTATVTDSTGHEQTRMVGLKRPEKSFALADYLWFWDLIFPPHERQPPAFSALPVGQNIVFKGAFSGQDHVLVNARFTDQTEMVIVDMNI